MAYTSGSEDDFPDIEVVVRRHKQKTRAQKDQHSHQEETAPADRQLPKERRLDRESAEPSSAPAVKATPLRRRKLGQTQTQKVDSSLLKPWNELDMGRKQKEPPTGSNAPRLRSREGTAEASDSSKPTLPAEQSKPRTASSRPALRSAELGESSGAPSQLVTSTQRESKAGKGTTNSRRARRKVVYSSESEEDSEGSIDDPEPSENDEGSEFLSAQEDSDTVIWNSDSELFLTPPTRRSKSPSERHTKPSRKGASKTSPTNDAPSATIAKGSKNPTPTEEPKAKSKNRGQRGNPASKASEATQKKGNLEDAFEKLKIFNEDSEPDDDVGTKKAAHPILEPVTPRKKLTSSPFKVPQIPDSAWKPEHKEFWDPEVNFAWIDKHSPEKKRDGMNDKDSPKKKNNKNKKPDLAGANDSRAALKLKYGTSPEKREARRAFDAVKESLARDFLDELDARITGGRLARMTASTGGLRITWSSSLNTTAGRAHWKCRTVTKTSTSASASASATATATAPTTEPTATTTTTATPTTKIVSREAQHHASIELASKVLSNEADLLNTVAHEFCHLAVFILDGRPKAAAHGAEFKAWGRRASEAFASRGIEVTTRHSYEIEYRYIWRCDGCAGEVKRHSRSVDVERQRCGGCRGRLVQVKPVPRGGGGGGGSASTKAKAKGKGMNATADNHENEQEEEENDDGGGGAGTKLSKEKEKEKEKPPQKKEKKLSAYQEFTSREMKALSKTCPGMSFKDKIAAVAAKWKKARRDNSNNSNGHGHGGPPGGPGHDGDAADDDEEGDGDRDGGGEIKGLQARVEVLEIVD